MNAVLAKWGVAILAMAASAVFVHWLFVLPPPAEPDDHRVAFFVRIILEAEPGRTAFGFWIQRFSFVIVAATGLIAAALALAIVFRTSSTPATRRLSGALALGSAAAAYFFYATAHSVYHKALQLEDTIPFLLASFLAYAAGVVSPYLLMRFFMGYPRSASAKQWVAHFELEQQEVLDKARRGWRRSFYPRWMVPTQIDRQRRGWIHIDLPAGQARMQAFLDSPRPLPWILAIAAVCALADTFLAKNFWWFLAYVAMLFFMVYAYQGLHYHRRNALPDDRSRIDWIYGTLVFGGLLFMSIGPLWWTLLIVLIPAMEASGMANPGKLGFAAPVILALQLYFLAFVISLALSIFYRGTLDPRLAMRRLTLYGFLGLGIAFLFVLLERAVAIKLVEWLKLPPESGVLLSGVAVAATIAPIRGSAERAVNGMVARLLPLESIVQGDRRVAAVVLSDLAGYTALSAKDEKEALLLAALLQRQASKLADAHGGRVVKSMGDAVMLTFHDAVSAVHVLRALHRDFKPAAMLIGITPLEVHSGAHFGEVTVTHDGDLYGQTVNIAARLQGLARPGQAVVSTAFAEAGNIEPGARTPMGPQHLKNVPDPVSCEDLQVA